MRFCRYIFSEMDIDGGDTRPVSENASTYQEHGIVRLQPRQAFRDAALAFMDAC
jgi:hypothetical protein